MIKLPQIPKVEQPKNTQEARIPPTGDIEEVVRNQAPSQSQPLSTDSSERKIVKPSKTLLTWEAPERLFKKRSREFYRKIIVIIIFFMLLLLIIKEFILIALLAVFFFVVYVFHTVPPRIVRHEITTNGINYAGEHQYLWTELDSFFIEKKDGTNIANVNTVNPLPGRLFLLLSDEVNPAELSEILNRYISIIENPEVTMIDKMVKGISKRIDF